MTTSAAYRDRARPTLVATMVFAFLSAAAAASGAPALKGSIAGKVFDGRGGGLLAGVTVGIRWLDSDEERLVVTDAAGGYLLDDAPTGVYAFTLRSDGMDYPVSAHVDARFGMPFLLESCFELDGVAGTARVREECDSGLVAEARVAQIGPQRFLVPVDLRPQDPDQPEEQEGPGSENEAHGDHLADTLAEDGDLVPIVPESIDHEELECLIRDHYPLVNAGIHPGDAVQSSRVYFRSDKYPDFYYVDMVDKNPTIDDFRAILPKPSPETERIYYYLESVDSNFDSLQTPEFDPEVLEAGACKDSPGAYYEGEEPGILVGATQAGASAVPPGFQAAGITGFVSSLGVLTTVGGAAAASGGIASTTGLVLVVSGGAAAATGATVVVTNDKEASPP